METLSYCNDLAEHTTNSRTQGEVLSLKAFTQHEADLEALSVQHCVSAYMCNVKKDLIYFCLAFGVASVRFIINVRGQSELRQATKILIAINIDCCNPWSQ